jgi:hypothetical protein
VAADVKRPVIRRRVVVRKSHDLDLAAARQDDPMHGVVVALLFHDASPTGSYRQLYRHL